MISYELFKNIKKSVFLRKLFEAWLWKYPCFDVIYRIRVAVGLWEKRGLQILEKITIKHVWRIPLRDFFCHLFVEVNIVVVQIVFLWSSSSFYRPSFSKTKNTKTFSIEKKWSESKLFSNKQLVLFKSANISRLYRRFQQEFSPKYKHLLSVCLISINKNWKSYFLITSSLYLSFYPQFLWSLYRDRQIWNKLLSRHYLNQSLIDDVGSVETSLVSKKHDFLITQISY